MQRAENRQQSVLSQKQNEYGYQYAFYSIPPSHTQGLGDISKMEIEKNVRVRRWTPHSIAVACTDS